MKKQICLKTERLFIVPMTEEELELQIKEEKNEAAKAAYKEMLKNCENEPEDYIWFTPWKIILKENQKALGDVSFNGPEKNGVVEVKYAVLPGMQRQGYMTEALGAVINWAFSQKDVFVVMGETAPGNIAAQRVLENNGFVMFANGQDGPRYKIEKRQTYQSIVLIAIIVALDLISYLILKMTFPYIILLVVTAVIAIVGVVYDIYRAKRRERITRAA